MKVTSAPDEASHRQARERSPTVQTVSPAVRATTGANGHDANGCLQATVPSRNIRSVTENVNFETETTRRATSSAVRSVNATTLVPPKEKESVVGVNRTSRPGQATKSEEGLTAQEYVSDKIIGHGEAEDAGTLFKVKCLGYQTSQSTWQSVGSLPRSARTR